MKQNKMIHLGIDTVLVTAFLLWSVFYPDLYLVKDVCSVVECDDAAMEDLSDTDASSYAATKVTLEEIGNAKPGQIVIKSKLLEWLKEGKK